MPTPGASLGGQIRTPLLRASCLPLEVHGPLAEDEPFHRAARRLLPSLALPALPLPGPAEG
eukprot:615977-Alexandrium_andersonii.AAC.1